MPTPNAATPGAAKPAGAANLLKDPGAELLSLPQQAEEITRDLYRWLRTDSLGALAGIALGVGLYFALVLVRGWARRRLGRVAQFGSWGWVALRVVARTRSLFLVAASAKVVDWLFEAPPALSAFIGFLFTIAAVVQGAFWVREFLVALVERKAIARDGDAALSSAVGVVTVIINVVVCAIAGVILLDNLGVNVTALVAGLGIGGIAIGLAAQGIFSDLFAALSILLDQPFKRGDTIQIGGPQGVIGTVEHIGLKTTRLRALSGEIVIMSNANLLNQQINNFAAYEERRVVMLLELIYQIDPDLLARVPDELRDIVNGVAGCRFDRAHFINFATSSLDFELVFHVENPDLVAMMTARQAVAFATLRRFRELGIDFAYPSQTSFLAGADGRIVDPHPGGDEVTRPAHLAGGRRPPAPRGA